MAVLTVNGKTLVLSFGAFATQTRRQTVGLGDKSEVRGIPNRRHRESAPGGGRRVRLGS